MVMSDRSASGFGDTTYTKVFVGGLAWETQRETMKSYFDQFGEIHEAVVITDRNTGKSKGYGFVTFKDPESARKACDNPYPVIDGRRANCNLAYLGAQKNRPNFPQHGMEKIRPPPKPMAESTVHGNSKYFRQPVPQHAFSYSAYGYPAYSQHINPMNYYNTYGGGQQFPSYYPSGASRFPGVYLNYYPFYAHNEQSSPTPTHYPKMVQFPYLPHQYSAAAAAALGPSQSLQVSSAGPATASVTVPGKPPGTASEQNSSA
ncbi:hypothetical protein JRO89_XS15G0010600 [Xanthoceras sorbifolium]|uniref:RRM domain-containing protein n=1 Tax=Xanthoceras sorbifolium TaxID=99658 RepID=A0ABQ8H0L4_9ROSI|nr:hypothetical protein JRO89_XS15G0010600 [Xanthoceras sorbifolium]